MRFSRAWMCCAAIATVLAANSASPAIADEETEEGECATFKVATEKSELPDRVFHAASTTTNSYPNVRTNVWEGSSDPAQRKGLFHAQWPEGAVSTHTTVGCSGAGK